MGFDLDDEQRQRCDMRMLTLTGGTAPAQRTPSPATSFFDNRSRSTP